MSDPSVHKPGVDDLPVDKAEAERRAANRRLVCTIYGKHDDPKESARERRRFRETYKARLWREHYGRQLPEGIGIDYLDIGNGAVTAKLRAGEQMVDAGDAIYLKRSRDDGPSDSSIAAMLACAEAKDWQCIRFEGSNSFKERSALAAALHVPPFDIDWEGSGINDETRQRIERKAKALRTGIGQANGLPSVSAAPAPGEPRPKGKGDELDQMAEELRAPNKVSAEAMREKLEAATAKWKEAKERAAIGTKKREQAINDVMAEGLEQMPGDGERKARPRRPRP